MSCAQQTALRGVRRQRPGVGERRRWPVGDSGLSTLETVLVVPVLLLAVMLAFQLALWWHARHVAEAAAQEGLRAARAYDGTAAAGHTRTQDYLDRLGGPIITSRQVHASRTATEARLTVRGTSPRLVPGVTLLIKVDAASPVERFTVGG